MLAVGIDIGGTNTKIGIVTAKDGCLIKREFSTKKYTSIKHYFTRLVLEIEILLDHFPDHPVAGIGIGAPGVDDHTGKIVASENIKWLPGFDLSKHLSDYFEIKVRLINDANMEKDEVLSLPP